MIPPPSPLLATSDTSSSVVTVDDSIFLSDIGVPDPQEWFVRNTGMTVGDGWLIYSRGPCRADPPAGKQNHWHGTSMRSLHAILRDGFLVSDSTHAHKGKSYTGMFGIGDSPDREAPFMARNLAAARAKTNLGHPDDELPNEWCCPVVLCVQISGVRTVARLKTGDCPKNVLAREPGSRLKLTGYLELHIPTGTYNRYRGCKCLHQRSLGAGDSVMCGGRLGFPLLWQKGNMAPSCGRCVNAESALREGWTRSKSEQNWFCTMCIRYDSPSCWLGV